MCRLCVAEGLLHSAHSLAKLAAEVSNDKLWLNFGGARDRSLDAHKFADRAGFEVSDLAKLREVEDSAPLHNVFVGRVPLSGQEHGDRHSEVWLKSLIFLKHGVKEAVILKLETRNVRKVHAQCLLLILAQLLCHLDVDTQGLATVVSRLRVQIVLGVARLKLKTKK